MQSETMTNDAGERESTRSTKPSDPKSRMGIYKTLDEVPDRYRLHRFSAAYQGEDTWQEFAEQQEYPRVSEKQQTEVDRAGDHWKAFMAERERHHALATPEDVEAWCADLLAGKSLRRSHDYFLRVRRFYDWLQDDAQHDHRHHPVLIAANEGEAAHRIWRYKIRQTRKLREEYRRQGETNE